MTKTLLTIAGVLLGLGWFVTGLMAKPNDRLLKVLAALTLLFFLALFAAEVAHG